MIALRAILLGVALLSGLLASPALAQPDRLDVYFIAVGSARYAPATAGGQTVFTDILGAGKSARLVADILSRGGSTFGVVLTSTPGKFVSRADIEQALDSVEVRIARDKPKNPLLVFYFAGHGVSEGVGWNLFAVPGDVVASGDPNLFAMDRFASITVHAAELVQHLRTKGTPFLVLFDTCYDGKEARFDSPLLGEQNNRALETISSGFKQMNQFVGADPVLFSTTPGTTVEVADDPKDEDGDKLAPISRRLLLLRDAQPGTMSLRQFIKQIRMSGLDPRTRPPVTFAEPGALWDDTLLTAAAEVSGNRIERRIASATEATVCCGAAKMPEQQALTGSIEIFGAKDDFISDGVSLRLTGANAIEPGSSDTIRLELPVPDGVWTVELGSPKGQALGIRAYPKVDRWPFQDEDAAGMAINSPGRSCNALRGAFAITALARDGTHLRELAFEARQICDDGAGELKVRAKLRAGP